MKRLALASLIAITMGHGAITYAQESVVGTYTGSYTQPTNSKYGDTTVNVQLIIASVENGVVKGTAKLYSTARFKCPGDYPMEGNYDGNKLVMKAMTKGGPTGDCTFSFNVAQVGNKLIGSTGLDRPIQLSK